MAEENDDLGPVEITAQDSIIAIGLCRYNRKTTNALKDGLATKDDITDL